MDLVSRIRQVVDSSRLSVRAFAISCGMKQQTLDRMLKGMTAISVTCVSAVLEQHPEISAEWLLRGEGPMLKSATACQEAERINKLVDTIATLQDAINEKNKSIQLLSDQLRQLRGQA